MCVNEIATIVYSEWYRTGILRPYVTLDTVMVMPDHIHGIIIINKIDHRRGVVETLHATSLPHDNSEFHSLISPKSTSLPIIIRSFKSAVTNKCHATGYPNFQWQPRFYERIIHAENELNIVRQYIMNSPKNWNRETP